MNFVAMLDPLALAKRQSLLAMVALAAALADAAVAAEICKWTDRDGSVHYSDVAPPGQACAALIRVMHADPEETARAEQRRRRELARLAEAADAGRLVDQQAIGQDEAAAQRAERCSASAAELRFLERADGMRLVRPGRAGDAELDWLDDEERAALINDWRRQVRAWCAGAMPPEATPERAYAVPAPPRRPPPP